jgi:hypothetical protein
MGRLIDKLAKEFFNYRGLHLKNPDYVMMNINTYHKLCDEFLGKAISAHVKEMDIVNNLLPEVKTMVDNNLKNNEIKFTVNEHI